MRVTLHTHIWAGLHVYRSLNVRVNPGKGIIIPLSQRAWEEEWLRCGGCTFPCPGAERETGCQNPAEGRGKVAGGQEDQEDSDLLYTALDTQYQTQEPRAGLHRKDKSVVKSVKG